MATSTRLSLYALLLAVVVVAPLATAIGDRSTTATEAADSPSSASSAPSSSSASSASSASSPAPITSPSPPPRCPLSTNDPAEVLAVLRGNLPCEHLALLTPLGDATARDIAVALAGNTGTTALWFGSKTRVTDLGLTALAGAVAQNRGLRTLGIWGGVFGDAGASDLARALGKNEALKSLSIENSLVGTKGQAALGEALALNRHLRTLKLKLSAAKRRDYDGTIALLQGIARNTGLRFASLPNTAINIDVARALAACVRTNTVLEHLHFARCRMPDAAAAVVAEALQDASPALFSLALDGSEITDVGATMLGQALAHRPSPNLRRLSLADGLFGDGAALALGEALTKNTRLEELSLRSNGGITPRGALGLLESLRAGRGNMVLSLLDLGGREGGLVDNHEFQAFRAQHLARAAGVGGMKGKTGMKLKPKSEEFKRQLFRYRLSGGRGEAPDAVIEDEETRALLETAEAWPEVLDSALLEGIEAICARNRDWKPLIGRIQELEEEVAELKSTRRTATAEDAGDVVVQVDAGGGQQ